METITDLKSLRQQIAILEQKQEKERQDIEDEIHNLFESLKPVNLIKRLFHSVKESPDLRSDILNAAVGLGTGFLTNKLLLGKVHGPLKSILGAVLPMVLSSVSVKSDAVKNTGLSFLAKMLKGMKIKSGSDVEDEHATAGAIL